MSTAENHLDNPFGNIDFAGRKRSRRQSLTIPRDPQRPFTSPTPSNDGGFKFGRRHAIPLIIGGTTVVIGGVTAVVLEHYLEHTTPETLESLVTQAKKMEEEYKREDLSDKTTREKYVNVLAGIFAFHNPEYFSKKQLVEAVKFTDSVRDFTQQLIDSSVKSGTPTSQDIEFNRETTAATYNKARKITVNAAAESYKKSNLPRGWNPLKILRLALLHEFNHLVAESTDPIIFSIMDPNNRLKDKWVEGFRVVGINDQEGFGAAFDDLHEATIELLARDISQSDFGSYYSNRDTRITGEEITTLIGRLETILQVISMTHEELAKLHKNSNLRQFLLIIADKVGMSKDAPLESRIRYGSIIAGAIERNDAPLLQGYINQVKLFQQK